MSNLISQARKYASQMTNQECSAVLPILLPTEERDKIWMKYWNEFWTTHAQN